MYLYQYIAQTRAIRTNTQWELSLTETPDTRMFDGHLPRRDAVRAR